MTQDRRVIRLGQGEFVDCETGEIFETLQDKQLKVNSKDPDSLKQCAFTTRKKQAQQVAKAYLTFDEKNISKLIHGCGHRLYFSKCPSGHYQKLTKAFFCKKRLCPMCQWRRSLKTFGQVSKIAEKHFNDRKTDKAVLLTLTVPNCKAEDLKNVLSDMTKAFNNLMRRDEILSLGTGWFRSAEVTYSRRRGDYHPHFHVLITFSKRDYDFYMDKRQQKKGIKVKSQLHITQDHIRRRWTDLNNYELKDGQTLVCDIRRIKVCDVKAIAEVAKYATKPSDYIGVDDQGNYFAFSNAVKASHEGLFRKRLLAFGKSFKDIKKDLDLDDVEKADTDLVNVDDSNHIDTCPDCQKSLEEHEFVFRQGFYIKDK